MHSPVTDPRCVRLLRSPSTHFEVPLTDICKGLNKDDMEAQQSRCADGTQPMGMNNPRCCLQGSGASLQPSQSTHQHISLKHPTLSRQQARLVPSIELPPPNLVTALSPVLAFSNCQQLMKCNTVSSSSPRASTPAFTLDVSVQTPPSTFDVAQTPNTICIERQQYVENASNLQHVGFGSEELEQSKETELNLHLRDLMPEQRSASHMCKQSFKNSYLEDVDPFQRIGDVFGDAQTSCNFDSQINDNPTDEQSTGFQMLNNGSAAFSQALDVTAFKINPGLDPSMHPPMHQNNPSDFSATTDPQDDCPNAAFFSEFTEPDTMLNDQSLDVTMDLGFPHTYSSVETDFAIPWEDWSVLSVPDSSVISSSRDLCRRDTSRDEELLTLRQSGLSYREIKKNFGFKEAESTLRGRYRTLTKPKGLRVRKPEWKEDDVSGNVFVKGAC